MEAKKEGKDRENFTNKMTTFRKKIVSKWEELDKIYLQNEIEVQKDLREYIELFNYRK